MSIGIGIKIKQSSKHMNITFDIPLQVQRHARKSTRRTKVAAGMATLCVSSSSWQRSLVPGFRPSVPRAIELLQHYDTASTMVVMLLKMQ